MKKILIAAAAIAAVAAATPAMAVTANLNGTVAKTCNAPTGTYSLPVDLTLDADGRLNGGDGNFTQIVDLNDVFSGEVFCNTAATVSVTASKLINTSHTGPVPSGFTRDIPVRLNGLSVGGTNGISFTENALNTGSTLDYGGAATNKTVTKASTGAFAGNVQGVLELWNDTRRPLAGSYQSSWTVTLTTN